MCMLIDKKVNALSFDAYFKNVFFDVNKILLTLHVGLLHVCFLFCIFVDEYFNNVISCILVHVHVMCHALVYTLPTILSRFF